MPGPHGGPGGHHGGPHGGPGGHHGGPHPPHHHHGGWGGWYGRPGCGGCLFTFILMVGGVTAAIGGIISLVL